MTDDGRNTPTRRIEEPEDSDLLRCYADTGSQEAFARLVHRRIDFVYSVALRQTGGDRHRAEDAAQAVFTDLARKSRTLAARPVLVGWLYHSARFAAASLVRTEQRRQAREQEAHTMQTVLTDSARDAEWQQVRPVLDEALNEISERDRDAILLRYFDGRSFPEIGARLRLTENAARMRVERALEQLDVALRKRGITSSASALAAAVGVQVTAASPAGLATAVTGTALAQASLGAVGWAPAVLGVGTFALASTAAAAVVVFAVIQVRSGEADQAWQPEVMSAMSPARPEVAVQFNPSGDQRNQPDTDVRSIVRQRTAAFSDEAIHTGRQFLTAYPEAQSALAAVRHRMFEHIWGFALRQMNLSARERDEIERRVCDALPWAFAIETRGWEFGFGSAAFMEIGQVAERELRSALGDAGFEIYRECYARRPVYELVQTMAAAAYEVGAPLTPAQTAALVDVILRHGAQRREIAIGSPLPGARLTSVDLRPVDWALVSREMDRVLEPKQLAALDAGKRSFEAGKLEERAKASLGEAAAISGSPQQNSWDNTQLQARAVERFAADLPVKYAQFYRLRGLDDAAISSFEKLMTDFEASRRDLRATERTIRPSGPNVDTREAITVDGKRVRVALDRSIATLQRQEEERFRAAAVGLLGDDGYVELQTFEGGADSRALVAEFVSERALSGTPVSFEQGQRLTSELRNLNYRRKIEPQNNRWDDIAVRGCSILTQDQMPAWEAFIAHARDVALSTQLARWIDAWRKAN